MSLERWNPDNDVVDEAETTHRCDNCGGHVTDDYYRVFSVDGVVEVCPFCPDRVRIGGRGVEARSHRHSGGTDFEGVVDDD